MAMGRPTKYTPDIIYQIDTYLQSCGREQTELPTHIGFARFIGVDTDTLVEWGKKYKDFSVALKRLDEAQQVQLMNDGLYGGKEVNSSMAIFLLKANHGLIETSRTEHTGKDGKDLPTPILQSASTNVQSNNSDEENK